MKRVTLILASGFCCGWFATSVVADNPTAEIHQATTIHADRPALTPPPRPLPLTCEQDWALQELSASPEHADAALAGASYSPATERKLRKIGVHVTQAILPVTVLTLLIAAAPL